MWLRNYALCIMLSSMYLYARAQDTPAIPNAAKVTGKYVAAVNDKFERLSGDIDHQTIKYLQKLEKCEDKIRKRLSRVDSTAAHNIFASSSAKYQALQNSIRNKTSALQRGVGQYIPGIDSAGCALAFLDRNPLTDKLPIKPSQIKDALNKVHALRDEFNQADNVKVFIHQRQAYLKEQLGKYDFEKELKQFSSTGYYYSQQIGEYRAMIDDPNKAEQKALELLRKLPAFQQFIKEHGALAGLFNIPAGYGQGVAGLQTISTVQDMIQQRIGNLGPNGQQVIQQNIAAAQSQLTKLRNRYSQAGDAPPDFKPSTLRTKSFAQRLEYGTALQSQKANGWYPTTTDASLTVAYRASEKSSIGLGASYRIAYGKDIRHVALSSAGTGFKSFADIKLKGSFYGSGGFEYNYQQPFVSLRDLPGINYWSKSGLIGLSKVLAIKSRVFKKTRVALLWDFLSYYQNTPGQSPFKFKAGYQF